MTRLSHMRCIVLIAIVGVFAIAPALFAQGGQGGDRSGAEDLARAAQGPEPTTVSLAWHTYGFSATPKGEASLMAVRIAGPQRVIWLDQRTAGDPVDWSLPGEAPDGSYRYEVFVTTTLDGEGQSDLTAGGFEVQNGQILRP